MNTPTLKPNSRRCQCPACWEYFNSAAGFDKHRTGHPDRGRRCLTVEEMTARGMHKNAAGFWVTEALTSRDGHRAPSWVVDASEKEAARKRATEDE